MSDSKKRNMKICSANNRRLTLASVVTDYGLKSRSPIAYLLPLCLAFPAIADQQPFSQRLAEAALERTKHNVTYNGAYVKIPYPGGDVPADTGVCTDVVIRSYRKLGIDLQKDVHEEMRHHFNRYPKYWGLKKADSNIDHRRVLNLRVFFKRKGKSLPVTDNPDDYKTGNLVTWMLPGNLPHIGIIVDKRSEDGKRPLVVHNIGAGPQLEDMLFAYTITGHYQYHGPKSKP